MKRQQIEPWRLIAAIILLGFALVVLAIRTYLPGGHYAFWIIWASLLAAAIGTPFRRGIAVASSVPFVAFLLFWDLLIMWVLRGAG